MIASKQTARQTWLSSSIITLGVLAIGACSGSSGSAPPTPTNFVVSINGTPINSGQYSGPTNAFQWPGGTSFTVQASEQNFSGTFTAQIGQTPGSGLCWAVQQPTTQPSPAVFTFSPTILCTPGTVGVIISGSQGQGRSFYVAPTF
jgi:hypothetical protein